jgi:hypothetical protein
MDILHGSSPLPILVKYTPIFVRFVTLPTAALRIRLMTTTFDVIIYLGGISSAQTSQQKHIFLRLMKSLR